MKRIFCLAAIPIILSGCKVFYPDRLFRIDEDKLALADTIKTAQEYVIRYGDLISLAVFSNNGYDLVDVFLRDNSAYSPLNYLVKQNGYALLPILDSVYLEGLTISEAEKVLEEKYGYYFVTPFVRIEVTNKNVYLYRGRGGAVVVNLDHENMNLLEVIAKAGGIPQYAKAYRVRIIRGNVNSPIVFDIDLSTIEGMQNANLTMVANDIVYIETKVTSGDVLTQVAPVITLLSTMLLLYTTVKALSGK